MALTIDRNQLEISDREKSIIEQMHIRDQKKSYGKNIYGD